MKRSPAFLLFIGTLLGSLAFAFAQSQPPDALPNSAVAVKALSRYREELRKLDEEYAQKVTILRQQYVKELDKARKESLGKDDLDEAQRLLSEKKRIATGSASPGETRSLVILSALFGIDDKWIDITNSIQKQVQNAQLSLRHDAPLSELAMPDLAPGRHKSRVIIYKYDGKAYLSITRDDQDVELPLRN